MCRKVSVPRCLLTLAQNIRLCDIFLMRSRISTLLRMDIVKEINDPHREQSHQSRIWSAGLPVLLPSHGSCLGTIQSLVAPCSACCSNAWWHQQSFSPLCMRMLEVNHRAAPCFHLSSSLGCESCSAAGYFGCASKYLAFNSARCFHSQQLPQQLWKGTVSVVPAGCCGWIATDPW